jgi:hypothetical protein
MAKDLRQLRHDLRGSVNILMLCAASLRHADAAQQLEFLEEIILATDRTLVLLDELEALPEHFASDMDEPQSA